MGHMTNSSSELTHYSFVTGLWPTPGVWPASEANCYSKVKPYKFRTSYLVLWNRDVKAFEVSSNHIHGIFQWQIRMRRKRKFAKGEERDERNRGRWQRIGEKGKERARSKRSHEFGGKKVKVHDSDLKWVSLDATSLLFQRQLWLWTRIRCFFALFIHSPGFSGPFKDLWIFLVWSQLPQDAGSGQDQQDLSSSSDQNPQNCGRRHSAGVKPF